MGSTRQRLEAIDRLTLVLVLERQGRPSEVISEVDAFFAEFPGADQGVVAERIRKRRNRAQNRLNPNRRVR